MRPSGGFPTPSVSRIARAEHTSLHLVSSPRASAPEQHRPPTFHDNPGDVRVKGISFITFLEAVAKSYGPEARQRIEREAPGELGNALRFGGIVAGGWYKLSWYRVLWDVIGTQLKLDDAGARRLSQRATAIGVNVVYRTLAKVTSPSVLFALGPRIFRQYFDRGRFAVVKSDPGSAIGEWYDCNGFDSHVWTHVAGGAIYFLDAAGAKQVNCDVMGGGGDANWMRAQFTYR